MWPPCSRLLVGGLQNLEVTITCRRLCTVANVLDLVRRTERMDQMLCAYNISNDTVRHLECHDKNITVNIFFLNPFLVPEVETECSVQYIHCRFFGSFEQDV